MAGINRIVEGLPNGRWGACKGSRSMTRARISVCVVTYNQRSLIETCLRSILDQAVDADVQVLVGDDASTDGTSAVVRELVAEYGSRLRYFLRESNLGAAANMCHLFAHVDGDFVARVDGDDYWLPGKLQRQLVFLETHPECSAVYTNAIAVDEAGVQVGVFNDIKGDRIDLATLLRRGNTLNNSSVLFRIENIAGWAVIHQVDYQVHLWQARLGWLGHIGEPLTAYRVNTQGSLVLNASEWVRESYWQAIQSVPRESVTDDDYAHGLADFMRRVAFRAVRRRDLSLVKQWLPKILQASPYGKLRTIALVVANIVRMAALELIGLLPGRTRVLYRR
jgi:glycosyltransferase involved in cell wall biosynthesis